MRVAFVLLLFTLGVTAHLPVYAENDDNGHADKQKTYALADDVLMKPEVKILYDKPRIVVKAVYPSIYSETVDENIDDFNNQVSALIQDQIANFREKVMDNSSAQNALPRSSVKNDLVIDFNTSVIGTNDSPILSIRFSIQGTITGVAHSYHTHQVLNYDLYNGKQMQLADFFKPDAPYLSVISNYTNQTLTRRLSNKEKINEGTAATDNHFQLWNINPYGLLITFDEGQVAPPVYGTQTVLIPYSVLKPMLVPDSAMMHCATHRKSCVQHNLLTGGFIDEAALVPTAHSPWINAGHRFLNPSTSKH